MRGNRFNAGNYIGLDGWASSTEFGAGSAELRVGSTRVGGRSTAGGATLIEVWFDRSHVGWLPSQCGELGDGRAILEGAASSNVVETCTACSTD